MNTPTDTGINQQTAGPLVAKCSEIIAAQRETLVAEAHGPTAANRTAERAANRRLLAASFTAFDKAGRALGLDAATLAESVDLAELIRALQLCEQALTPSRNSRDLIAADEARAALSTLRIAPMPRPTDSLSARLFDLGCAMNRANATL